MSGQLRTILKYVFRCQTETLVLLNHLQLDVHETLQLSYFGQCTFVGPLLLITFHFPVHDNISVRSKYVSSTNSFLSSELDVRTCKFKKIRNISPRFWNTAFVRPQQFHNSTSPVPRRVIKGVDPDSHNASTPGQFTWFVVLFRINCVSSEYRIQG